ncbi:unnamed protein product [Blepharisma stoltei]|uniref:Uncharacterized protein n=1 Tax=Blepharisma stoltei TaxID=1481888 RepID=A0AAU9JSH1_9CILI|nr:unnamed protein product [Blepharisma stoltei]
MSSLGNIQVKLSDGRDLTELFQFLIEENARMEEEYGEPVDILDDDLERNLDYLPEHFRELCRDIFTVKSKDSVYKFDEPDSPFNVEFSPDQELVGATFLKLIEKITDEGTTELSNIVFYTFPIYSSPKELLEALIQRHRVPIPPLMSASEFKTFQMKKVRSIQSKVASLLKKWIKLWPMHFKEQKGIKAMLQRFLEDLRDSTSDTFTKNNCKPILQSLASLDEEEKEYKVTFGDLREPPPPQLPKEIDFKMEPLLLWSPTEIARQLSLIESDMLKAVGIGELLSRNWEKNDKETLAPNVLAISKRFASCRGLILNAIVSQSDFNNRVKIVKKLLEVATECLTVINNFESPFIINSALKSDTIRALDATCKEVKKSATHRGMWQKLEEIYDSNFVAVRQEMVTNNCKVPCFLALRQELNQNDIRRKDKLESGLINVSKHKATADVLERITNYQQQILVFHPIKMLYQYLKAQDFQCDEDALFRQAKNLEPVTN